MGTRVVVLGGGPGGYIAALRAASLGAEVTLVEKRELGGTCLNRGCIPTKVWLSSVELGEECARASAEGVIISGIKYDVPAIKAKKQRVIKQLASSVKNLLRKQRVNVIEGAGRFVSKGSVLVSKNGGGTETLGYDKCVIATGSVPSRPPVPGADLDWVVTGEEVFDMETVPSKVIIVGGGVMGVELAYLYSGLGAKVTVVEMLEKMLPQADADVSAFVVTMLKEKGINVMTSTRVTAFKQLEGRKTAELQNASGTTVVDCDLAILAAGRAPATRELGLENVDVKNERGWIKVDDRMRTNDPDVYAVGDVTGGPLLAHVASAEGVVAAENIMGCDSRIDLGFVPSCVYTSPELAWVGMTEPEAKQRFGEVRVGKLPLEASGKALAMGKARGFVKVLGDAKYGQILGVHMVGANVTEMIAGAVTAMRLEATTDFLGSIIFPHPTISETIMEAAKLAAGTSPYVRSLT